MSGISENKMTSEISYDSKRFVVASTLEIEHYYACYIVKDFTGLSLSEAVVFSGCYPYVILLLNNTNEHTIPKIRNNDDLLINGSTH